MGKILIILFLPLALLLIVSCKKDSDDIRTEYEKYYIELSSDYKFQKVTQKIEHNPAKINIIEFERTYEYSDNLVIVKHIDKDNYDTVCNVYTYYLNQNGLADSCLSQYSLDNGPLLGNTVFYYHYNQDNYLISSSWFGEWSNISYENGNQISFQLGSNVSSFQYNSLINRIDIGSFKGDYLGKLNTNLLQEHNWWHPTESNRSITKYSYKLNASGLVIKRTALTTSPGEWPPPEKVISEFIYTINK